MRQNTSRLQTRLKVSLTRTRCVEFFNSSFRLKRSDKKLVFLPKFQIKNQFVVLTELSGKKRVVLRLKNLLFRWRSGSSELVLLKITKKTSKNFFLFSSFFSFSIFFSVSFSLSICSSFSLYLFSHVFSRDLSISLYLFLSLFLHRFLNFSLPVSPYLLLSLPYSVSLSLSLRKTL